MRLHNANTPTSAEPLSAFMRVARQHLIPLPVADQSQPEQHLASQDQAPQDQRDLDQLVREIGEW